MVKICLSSFLILLLTPQLSAQFQPRVDYATGLGPVSVAVGDFNGDGKSDIVVVNGASGAGNTVSVLLGKGDGTFQSHVDYTIGGVNPLWVAVGDFNRDGKLDIVTTNECNTYPSCSNNQNGSVSILLGNGDGTFRTHVDYDTQIDPQYVVVADVNGDGILDLVVANYGPDYYGPGLVSILLGIGDGTFQAQRTYDAGINPIGVMVGDFNHDGKPDLAVVNNNGSYGVMILLGNGDGSFQPPVYYPTGDNPRVGVVADFNSDGNLDLAIANCIDNDLSILFGDGNGHFSSPVNYPTGSWVAAIAGGDFDGDGTVDLVTVNAQSGNVAVLKGNGNGTFQSPAYFTTGISPNTIAVADVNHDQAPDLVVTNYADNTVSVLLNKGPDFSIAASAASPVTINSGQSSTSTLTLTLLTAFNNPATLACSVQPTQSAPTCSFSENPATFDTSGNATVTLTLDAPTATASLDSSSPRHDSRQIPLLWLPVAGFALIGAGFSPRTHRRKLTAFILGCLLFGGLIFQAACAGVSSGGKVTHTQTTYTITVTATSGAAQHSATTTLTVVQ